MRELHELINEAEPGWEVVQQFIDAAKNKVEVLPVDREKAKEALYQLQVTTRSPMGAIVYETGGILIDEGWIRILGSGSERLQRSLADWSKDKTGLIVADDVLGGCFILNAGEFGQDLGQLYYFSSDVLEYEALNITYTEFLYFCFNNSLDQFYGGFRWEGWREEVSQLGADQVINVYPPLWSKEGKDFTKNSRKAVPAAEQYFANIDFRKEFNTPGR
jgi:hypothetical protein